MGNTDNHTREQGFKSSLGMSYKFVDLIADGEQWSNIKKVVHLSHGDSIYKESNLHNVLWQLHYQRVKKCEELNQFLHHQDELSRR